ALWTAPSTQHGALAASAAEILDDTQNRCSEVSRNGALQVGSGSLHPQLCCRGLSGLRFAHGIRALAGFEPRGMSKSEGARAPNDRHPNSIPAAFRRP